MSDEALLSRLLFESREAAEMLADITYAQTGREDESLRRLVAEIDGYRREQGWPADGYR